MRQGQREPFHFFCCSLCPEFFFWCATLFILVFEWSGLLISTGLEFKFAPCLLAVSARAVSLLLQGRLFSLTVCAMVVSGISSSVSAQVLQTNFVARCFHEAVQQFDGDLTRLFFYVLSMCTICRSDDEFVIKGVWCAVEAVMGRISVRISRPIACG